MGRVELPLFDLESPPRLALGMKELFLEGTEDTDFAFFQQQKHEVTLAMHRQEVPLISAFLTRAFGDMYLTLARTETAKVATTEAQPLKVGQLEREVEETSHLLEAVKEARAKAERKKVEELVAPCVEEVEEYKGSDEFKNLVLDMMVEE
ncbi:PREDICTED: LOC110768041 isoform [Prunus dulcis]|uniref:PREDICTED: LOC110768041 isoform n=1 Tax=Prunus dulcis TaxID=3755 RepID=A0A5E4FJM1_PRUDU|nr:PREDICTED: LOC110768041 isoform [Prunus dulcis]